ncbi:MAG TPA: class I SAM-dependent methyltransferase [Acidimicrobiia bacterium]|nr:class I SAM-dependent methyltransferase [Acidimicrobiia bacterium]
MADGVNYTLNNTWEKAHRRLTLLEETWDPGTLSRLTALGVGPGWRCLELGAGAGSVTRWLCDRVGPSGTVTAVDLEPRFLEADPRPNLDIRRCDILRDGVPGDGYDLVHARFLLIHLPDRDRIVAELVSRLRPGGVILLEESDFRLVEAAESALYAEVWAGVCAAAAESGGDWNWGPELPASLAAAGAVEVASATETFTFRGGDPVSELVAMTWEQVTPLLVAQGLAPERIAAATAELTDPGRRFPAPTAVAAWGCRPPQS